MEVGYPQPAGRLARLAEGQAIGRALLDVEARIGELSLQTPGLHPPGGPQGARPTGKPPKHERLGMTRARMEKSQAIARHPEAVARVVAEASGAGMLATPAMTGLREPARTRTVSSGRTISGRVVLGYPLRNQAPWRRGARPPVEAASCCSRRRIPSSSTRSARTRSILPR